MQEVELRRSPRRKIDPLPVSIIQLRGNRWVEKMHFGEILEVSTTGARIQVISPLLFEVGAQVEVLCFSRNGANGIDMQATPSHLTGGVVWKDNTRRQMGIAFTAS